MSDDFNSDEMYTDPNGTVTPVSQLTEEQAKTLLREYLRRDREDSDFFQSQIMPQINELLSEMDNLTVIINDQVLRSPTSESTASIEDIDAAFDRAGTTPSKGPD